MRRWSVLFTFLVMAILLAGPFSTSAEAGNDGYSYARIVRLSSVTGDVQITRPDQSKWQPAIANMPVEQGFALGTNNGRAEIEFENGSAVWLAENSVLQFTELALSNGGRISKLTLTQGTATFYANLESGETFGVSTPDYEIIPPGKSEFRVDLVRDGGSVSVFQGQVSASSRAGERPVHKGETFAWNANTPTQAAIHKNPSQDNWDHWVNSRSSVLSSGEGQTLQYTNAPFRYGMADLATYGGWGMYPGYGYGWQPWGISSNWAPFVDGQWMMYPGLGWTWVSFEPWGWTPYHFGQWVFSPAFGWLWLPGGYGFWSPAPVQWFVLGNRIGWRPIAPVHVNTVPAPVVIVTKGLGKAGPNRVVSTNEAGEKLESLSGPPLSNGKIATAQVMPLAQTSGGGRLASLPHGKAVVPGEATLVVPTASNLQTLRSGVVFDPIERRFTNGAISSGNMPPQAVVQNGAQFVHRVPGPPPLRIPVQTGVSQTGTTGPSHPGNVRLPSQPMPSAAPRAGGAGSPAAPSRVRPH